MADHPYDSPDPSDLCRILCPWSNAMPCSRRCSPEGALLVRHSCEPDRVGWADPGPEVGPIEVRWRDGLRSVEDPAYLEAHVDGRWTDAWEGRRDEVLGQDAQRP